MRNYLMGFLLTLVVLHSPKPATAASMDGDASGWGLLGYGYGAGQGFGVGARYQKVIVPQGILHTSRVRDEIGLEFGADVVHYNFNLYAYNYGYGYGYANSWTYNEVAPVLGLTWNFWFSDRLALYPKVDLGYRFGSWSDNNAGVVSPSGYGGPLLEGAAGVVYRLDRVALRAEAGSYGLRLGVGFAF
jgi:hypothetical protein